jgi:hypothetical protein
MVHRLREFSPGPGAVRGLRAALHLLADGGMRLRYELDADMHQLQIPPQGTPGPADELWRHTCFEAFIAANGAAPYREFNFSPSGQWAAYAFDGYRSRAQDFAIAEEPRIRCERSAGQLILEASVPAALMPAGNAAPGYRAALCAVLEHTDGRLGYWALHHPAARPDFHHADGFVLQLPATEHRHD